MEKYLSFGKRYADFAISTLQNRVFLPCMAQTLSDIKDWYLLHPDCVRCMCSGVEISTIRDGKKETI